MPLGPWLMLEICSLSVIVLYETSLVPVLMYGSETMLWKEERSRVRTVQMDNLRGLIVEYWEDGQNPECMGKGVMWREVWSR